MSAQVEIDQILKQASEAGAIPGAVAMAATRDEVIYRGAFGKRDVSKDTAMTPDSVFWIASMTKAITAAAAMQLVERDKLTLDAPLTTVLPDLAETQVLDGFDSEDTPRLRPPRQPITLRHLLTHTAGFCYDMWNGDMVRYLEKTGIPPFRSGLNAAMKVPIMRDPGTRWEYGTNIDFVGKVVEAVSGERLDSFFRNHLLAPLGIVAMHSRGAGGALTPIAFEIRQDPEFFAGGGGLYGTAPDYIKFTQMILNNGTGNGNRVLKPETVTLMSQNHIGELSMTLMASAVPTASNHVDFLPGIDKKYGLSFMINTAQTAEGRSAGSLAWAGLANTYYWIDPARDITGVIMMQVLPFADPTCLEVFSDFERAVYAALGEAQAA
jgi:CubicO group peptidase (beta-lactamase class C family)